MQRHHESQEPRSRSTSRSPLASPSEERSSHHVQSSAIAFVPFDASSSSGVNKGRRRDVRVQAARASAAARKRTIARKAARQNSAVDESQSTPGPDGGRRRSLSATSSSQSGFLASATSPDASPARSISAGQLESFKPYPITQWHPDVPALVDHFLKYFAPEDTTGGAARQALRSIWQQALNDTALFHAVLLNVGSHASASGALTVSTELLSQLKHSTIEGVNDALARSESQDGIDDAVIGAIALIGGWELVYGNDATYDTHMRGLETIVELRGGLYGARSPYRGFKPLSSETVGLILAAGHDLAVYASKSRYFANDREPVQEAPIALPSGLASLSLQQLLPPTLVSLVSRIAHLVPINDDLLSELGPIQHALKAWDFGTTIKASYSPFHTALEDSMRQQVSRHVRLAGLAICNFLRYTTDPDAQVTLEHLYREALELDTELLIATLFDELALWALFLICALTGHCETPHMLALKRLSQALRTADWFACRAALGRYAYSSAILGDRCQALWDAISASTITLGTYQGPREPTRFAKGVQHPTTWIGMAIVAEEG